MMYFEKRGGGFPLLFIPGWTLNHHIWDDLTPLLEKKYELVLVDLRGTGRSPKGEIGYSIPKDAEDLVEILENYKELSVVSHSRGVKVFLSLTQMLGEKIKCGVMIGSAGYGKVNSGFRAEMDKLEDFAKIEGKEKATKRIKENIKLGPVAGGMESMAKLKKASEGYEGWDLVGSRYAKEPDCRIFYEELKMPLAFVGGERDPLLSDIKEASASYKNSELHIIPGVGHFPMIEAPDILAEIITSFLKGKYHGNHSFI
jgi:3-oxoadipate enol-lactonase